MQNLAHIVLNHSIGMNYTYYSFIGKYKCSRLIWTQGTNNYFQKDSDENNNIIIKEKRVLVDNLLVFIISLILINVIG